MIHKFIGKVFRILESEFTHGVEPDATRHVLAVEPCPEFVVAPHGSLSVRIGGGTVLRIRQTADGETHMSVEFSTHEDQAWNDIARPGDLITVVDRPI